MSNLEKVELQVEPSLGSHFGDCVDEAIILAMQENVQVFFVHNANRVTINPQLIRNVVLQKREAE